MKCGARHLVTAAAILLALEYTDDGGHLNSLGRKEVAEQLLIILSELATEL
jgi:lysophospholipase L1-like esterase